MWKKLCLVAGVASVTGLAACVAVPVESHRPHYHHDHDRDGVPDRADRDRDGDGVPNYRDRRPDNPYRY
jgi:hypothetical protein